MESHCSQGSNNTESCKRRLIEFTFEVSIGEDLRLGLTNVANGRIGAVVFFALGTERACFQWWAEWKG